MVDYNLPDIELLNSDDVFGYKIFKPAKTYVVLGRSNAVESSTYMELLSDNNIEVIKRPSGGEAVLISPKTVIIAIKFPIVKGKKPTHYFYTANNSITECLEYFGVEGINSNGISDLSIGNKKILGSAIYKHKDSMFYHAVLNLSEDKNIIGKYLKHPSKEPDYRKGRPHFDFITSVNAEGYNISFYDIYSYLNTRLSKLNKLILL